MIAAIGIGVALGLGVYAWGTGAFYPCESIGRIAHASACTALLSLEGRTVKAMQRLPNDNLMVVTRQQGQAPTEPQRVLEIAAATGDVVTERDLVGIDPAATWIQSAVSRDGRWAAASILDDDTVVIELATGQVTARIPQSGAGFLGFNADHRLLVEHGSFPLGLPDPTRVEAYSLEGGGEAGVATRTDRHSIFATGVQAVLSHDGRLFAQGMDKGPDGAGVGIRIGQFDRPTEPGMLLTAQLAGGCSYVLPRLAFSPDGARLAVSLSCPQRWGAEATALLVWDVETGRTLARIATPYGDWDNVTWVDGDTLAVSRFNLGTRTSNIQLVALPRG